MPNEISGFTRDEIVNYITDFIGKSTTQLQNFIKQTIPLAEFRYCALHDWSFLKKSGLSLEIAQPIVEYELINLKDAYNNLYNLKTQDVQLIFDETNQQVLKKVSLEDIRRLDVESDDGSTSSNTLLWAPISDTRIRLYPPKFKDGTLKVDGKISVKPLLSADQYPTVPYRFQESFILYILATVLDRENDDRASIKKTESLALIKADIQKDIESSVDSLKPRLKHWTEVEEFKPTYLWNIWNQ